MRMFALEYFNITIMNEDKLYRMIEEKEGMVALAFPALMRKVYVWLLPS